MVNVKELTEHLDAAGLKVTIIDEHTDFGLPPSNFIEGTDLQYAYDATSSENLKRCPRLYQLENIEGWRSKDENVHLRFGHEVHKTIEMYERSKANGVKHKDALHSAVMELLVRTIGWDPDHKDKNRISLLRTVIWYLDKFEDETAETIMMANGKPAVEVSFMIELDYGPTDDQPYVLCGYLDRVVKFNDEIFFRDYKTTSYTLTQKYFDQYSPHNQMTLYTFACKVIFETVIKGGIIDAMQVKADNTEFGQGFVFRTNEQLDEWLTDFRYMLEENERYVQDNHWPMRETSCDKYGGCKFRGICNKTPKVRDAFLKSNFVKEERWNPLLPR